LKGCQDGQRALRLLRTPGWNGRSCIISQFRKILTSLLPYIAFNRCDVPHKLIQIITKKHCRKNLANTHPPFKPSVLGGLTVFPTHLPINQMHCEKSLLSPILALFSLISCRFVVLSIREQSISEATGAYPQFVPQNPRMTFRDFE
jgi:hypothetical protein